MAQAARALDDAPATPVEVVRHLSQLTLELRTRTDEFVHAEMDFAEKKQAYDVAEAKAYLKAPGTIPEKERTATEATEELAFAAAVARARVRGLQQQIKTLEIRIDVGRTYGATVRAEFKTLGLDGMP